MSVAHIFSSFVVGAVSVCAGVWLTRKYGPKLFPKLKADAPSFKAQAEAAKESIDGKAKDGFRNLADVLSDVERKRSSDDTSGAE